MARYYIPDLFISILICLYQWPIQTGEEKIARSGLYSLRRGAHALLLACQEIRQRACHLIGDIVFHGKNVGEQRI
jgi:hypothetical protein